MKLVMELLSFKLHTKLFKRVAVIRIMMLHIIWYFAFFVLPHNLHILGP